MSSRASIERVRVRFVHGQRLPAADLADSSGGELRRQELHIVGAHRTWGAALGLEVKAHSAGLSVSPGLAYDAYGRALLLRRQWGMLTPAELATATEARDVVIAWTECGSALRLATAGDTRPGLDVPLARFWIQKGVLGWPDLGYRRCVRSLAAPRIGAGHVPIDVRLDGGTDVFSAPVDTSAAGFRSTPAYVVTPTVTSTTDLARAASAGAAGPFVSISSPDAAGFTVDVRVWRPLYEDERVAVELGLEIAWLGVEAPPTCGRILEKLMTPIEVP